MSGIVTLTLNPALDVSVEVDRIAPGMKLRTSAPRVEPGGGGINAARAIAHSAATCSRCSSPEASLAGG